jgi:hypothetical protein
MTMCKANIGIDPQLVLWNHFVCTWLLLVLGVEAAILGGMDIYVKSGHGVYPYLHLPMSRSTDGW